MTTSHKGSKSDSMTLFVHWGRNGGGPRFHHELVEGAMLNNPNSIAVSFNLDAEIADKFQSLPCPKFPVHTYTSKRGVITGLPRLFTTTFKLRQWIKENNVKRVVCSMESIYQSVALPLGLPKNVEYVLCIHDGQPHPGERNLVQLTERQLELGRADRIVTLSESVAGFVRHKSNTPISVGAHPPFGLKNARTLPRTPKEPPVVAIFGRLQEYKGIELLLRAAKLVRSRSSEEFILRIIGTGPEQKWKDTGLGQEAEWHDQWIAESEVDSIIDEIDVMALPYTEASQSGPATLALTHAIPCVVTPVSALPEQVKGFGIVAREISIEAFADVLQDLLTNQDLYSKLSKGANEQLDRSTTWSQLAALMVGPEELTNASKNANS